MKKTLLEKKQDFIKPTRRVPLYPATSLAGAHTCQPKVLYFCNFTSCSWTARGQGVLLLDSFFFLFVNQRLHFFFFLIHPTFKNKRDRAMQWSCQLYSYHYSWIILKASSGPPAPWSRRSPAGLGAPPPSSLSPITNYQCNVNLSKTWN